MSFAELIQSLSPTDDFAKHLEAYERSYGENALLRANGPAWFPSADVIERANVTAVARELGLAEYLSLHRWSVQNRPAFWDLAIKRLGIAFRTPYTQTLDAAEPTKPKWLTGARLNIIDSCLAAEPESPAIIEGGYGAPRTTTYADLRKLIARVANALVEKGIQPGDAVGMVAPMTAATVATYLGVIAAGAAVVSIADSFSADEIATRLRISGAKLVVTQDVIAWGGKKLPLYEKVSAATSQPIVVITTDPATKHRPGDREWESFLSTSSEFGPVARDPHDPINILFSSGTTGEPKAIPWDHATPIKCATDAHFHHDLHPGDVACWPTNLGWMMGPWLIFASLLNRCAMALYAGAPTERGFGEFVQNAGVTMLGGVPSIVRAWRSTDCMKGLDWSRIRAFSSSGECSNAADQLFLMHLAGYRPVIEYCGGTEIGGGYVTGTVVQPCIPSTFTTPALGIDFTLMGEDLTPSPGTPGEGGGEGRRGILNSLEDGNNALTQPSPGVPGEGSRSAAGEVFLIGPSIGLSTRLLNRDHDAVYYNDAPKAPDGTPLRRHGDELEKLPNGYYRVAGRSDDTMNLGGINVGCAELERALTTVPGVQETAAVAVPPPGGGPSRLIVFTVLKPGESVTEADLKPVMQKAIRDQLNPLFRLEEVRIVAALPRTASNKVMRRELRALVK